MSKLEKLRDAKTLDDVAQLIGFVPKGLSYVLYKIRDDKKYTAFEIAKRGGGKRLINAIPWLAPSDDWFNGECEGQH